MQEMAWVLSIVLAIVFLVVGVNMAYFYERAKRSLPWVNELPEIIVKILGGLQILGAVGLIAPMFFEQYAWLTAVVASLLAMLMIMAVVFHVRRQDTDKAWLNGLLAVFLLIVAFARWTTTQLP